MKAMMDGMGWRRSRIAIGASLFVGAVIVSLLPIQEPDDYCDTVLLRLVRHHGWAQGQPACSAPLARYLGATLLLLALAALAIGGLVRHGTKAEIREDREGVWATPSAARTPIGLTRKRAGS